MVLAWADVPDGNLHKNTNQCKDFIFVSKGKQFLALVLFRISDWRMHSILADTYIFQVVYSGYLF